MLMLFFQPKHTKNLGLYGEVGVYQLTDDFKQKLRPLNEIKFFKANEIKVGLLYVGPIDLRGWISPALYERLHLLS